MCESWLSGGCNRAFPGTPSPALRLSAPVTEIPTPPALFLTNPCWGNLGLLSTVPSICTWLLSWVHSPGKYWLLQSQREGSACSKPSPGVGEGGNWKTRSFWRHLILLGKIWNVHWFVVCKLPSVFFVCVFVCFSRPRELSLSVILNNTRTTCHASPAHCKISRWGGVMVWLLLVVDHKRLTADPPWAEVRYWSFYHYPKLPDSSSPGDLLSLNSPATYFNEKGKSENGYLLDILTSCLPKFPHHASVERKTMSIYLLGAYFLIWWNAFLPVVKRGLNIKQRNLIKPASLYSKWWVTRT